MFIKILTPNHNGKIELTVKDLECLIQEAVDKATREKCAGCSRGYYGGGISYLSSTPSITLSNNTGVMDCVDSVTDCVDGVKLSIHATEANSNITGSVNTLMSKINETCN